MSNIIKRTFQGAGVGSIIGGIIAVVICPAATVGTVASGMANGAAVGAGAGALYGAYEISELYHDMLVPNARSWETLSKRYREVPKELQSKALYTLMSKGYDTAPIYGNRILDAVIECDGDKEAWPVYKAGLVKLISSKNPAALLTESFIDQAYLHVFAELFREHVERSYKLDDFIELLKKFII